MELAPSMCQRDIGPSAKISGPTHAAKGDLSGGARQDGATVVWKDPVGIVVCRLRPRARKPAGRNPTD